MDLTDVKQEQETNKDLKVTDEVLSKTFEQEKENLKHVVENLKSELSEYAKNELVNQWIKGAKEQLENLTIFKPETTPHASETPSDFNPNELTLDDVENYLKKGSK